MTDRTQIQSPELPRLPVNPTSALVAHPSATYSSTFEALKVKVALLTGGGDKPYAIGMATALTEEGISLEFIGSDDLEVPELLQNPRITFLNLRGSQDERASLLAKAGRILNYYRRLLIYAVTAEPKIFHILWHNKFAWFDRTLLLLYYKLLGKQIVLTAHNVNAGKRDGKDSFVNRLSLKSEYTLGDHIFVHTQKMKDELSSDFNISGDKVSVVPFGINNTVPVTSLSSAEAKQRLGLTGAEKAMLFFGNIAPYKGLEYLVAAFDPLFQSDGNYRLIIVGKPKGEISYWERLQRVISDSRLRAGIVAKIEYVPDEETELYFKAADVLILPYTHIFQSGVLLLGYSFGLPAIVADVGSLREEVVEGETGFVFPAGDSAALARQIQRYFASNLFQELENVRLRIKRYANERYSWKKVAGTTATVYSNLLQRR